MLVIGMKNFIDLEQFIFIMIILYLVYIIQVGGELNRSYYRYFTLSNYTYSGTIPEYGVCGRQYMTITDNNYIVTDKDGEPTNDYIK